MLIKLLEDNAYSDIIRKIRTTVDSMKKYVQVMTMRKTKDSLCLIRIQTNRDGREDFRHAIQNADEDAGSVRAITIQTQLENMDLDCITIEDNVKSTLRGGTRRDGDFGVHIFETATGTRPDRDKVSAMPCLTASNDDEVSQVSGLRKYQNRLCEQRPDKELQKML